MREIEIKAKVGNREDLLKKLEVAGVVFGEPKKQHDVVFCKPGQKEYEAGSIWLRVRTENDAKVIFTLKKDTGRKLDSIEHEVEVNDGGELAQMIFLMGNELFSDLTKTRRKAKAGEIEICFDDVEELGTFIEGEMLMTDDADAEKVIEELWEFFEKIGISREDQVFEGYDVLMRKKLAA